MTHSVADLLPVVQTEGALAFVLAHEIARVVGRHTSEFHSPSIFSAMHEVFKRVAELFPTESKWRKSLSAASRDAASVIVNAKHEQSAELEADEIGS